MTHLLDTNVCIGAMRGDSAILRSLASRHPNDLGVSMLTVYELYSGVSLCRNPARESAKVERFLEPVHVIPFDPEPAKQAAKLRSILQRRGELIGPYDLLIAAHAHATQVTLVTHNAKEFARVPDLPIEDWCFASE